MPRTGKKYRNQIFFTYKVHYFPNIGVFKPIYWITLVCTQHTNIFVWKFNQIRSQHKSIDFFRGGMHKNVHESGYEVKRILKLCTFNYIF